ncbi:cell division topological specificity factor MinE [Desulfotomaculum nigrificans]|uniref:cell division topological specificity factor MinE n=1 Tax=Desulfotomaculum nigrificans TaxID=1565 RepID=UPI0001FAE916|nr:cell division topological specificity factor MinE [Desulfotomaculum nigrificans]
MLDFLSRVFGRDSTSSKNVAKERLRLVLVHDRANVSPELLTSLKNDLIKVISNYMEIDEKALEVSLDSSEDQVALVANIPVKRMKRSVKSPA